MPRLSLGTPERQSCRDWKGASMKSRARRIVVRGLRAHWGGGLAKGLFMGGAGLLASCSATEVETTHYLGVFDPQQQVTQELYKLEIKGCANFASNADFASGWIPAGVADLVSEGIESKRTEGGAVVGHRTAEGDVPEAVVKPSRQFFEIGPLAVSKAPQDHRFVVVMGSDPDFFFQKMGLLTTLGEDPDAASLGSRGGLSLAVGSERVAVSEAQDSVAKALKAIDEEEADVEEEE